MKKILSIICCLAMIFILAGCNLKIPVACATNYPVTYLLGKIGGNYIQVCNLSTNELIQRAKVTDDFHEKLEAADAIFYISSLEPYFSIYQSDIVNAKAQKIDLAQTSAIYKFQRYTTTIVDGQFLTAETPFYDGDHFSNIDTYDRDVALWMDPIAMMSMAATIRDYLVTNYPENAKEFKNNYDELEVELARLDAVFQKLRNDENPISIVTMTPNFTSWQKAYGFRIYPVMLSRFGALPTEAQLNSILERIQMDGVQYIAYEENMPEDLALLYTMIEERLQLKRVNLNNISSLTEESIAANIDYLTLMNMNLAQLEELK